MLINFDEIEESVIRNFKGGEKDSALRIYDDGGGRIMRGRLESGASIGMHTHEENCEVLYIISGEGKAVCDGKTERLQKGSCHYCPKGHTHSLINDGADDLIFFAVVQ